MSRSILLAACLLAALAASPARADFTDGLDAAQKGDYAAALREWQPLASAGDATAQANLGILYEQGLGVEKNLPLAVEWYEKAANAGNVESQFHLGLIFALGQGVAKDPVKAFQWFEKAAIQGDARAEYNLGVLLADGTGRPADPMKAAEWFEKAARQDHAEAKYRYAVFIQSGLVKPSSPDLLGQYLLFAANAGIADAQFRLGQLYLVGKAPGTAGLEKNPVEAIRWLTAASDQKHIPATVELGLAYYQGGSVKQDFGKALKFFLQAAEAGRPAAQFNLCLMYQKGQGVPQDYVQAHFWCNLATAGFSGGNERDMAIRLRDEIGEEMSGRSLEKAQTMAQEWWAKRAISAPQ